MNNSDTKPVILTGLRANNDLHIGHYFGALLPPIDMARGKAGEYQINLFVPDLHSFTTPIDHGTLQGYIMNNLRIFVAAGLPVDHPDIHIYRQSYISAHSELTWILDCFTGFGEMSRMTQFKDKSANLGDERVSVGLFNYPVLMAADILLYDAAYVPVGDDQSQHLEFTRDIATRFNSQFGDIFAIPKPVKEQHAFFGKEQGLRIKDLADPTKKMSKSDESGKGIIFLGDTPETARKKIMSATTDSVGVIHFDPVKQPGISNLLTICALLSGKTVQAVSEQYEGQTSYGDFKSDVAELVGKFLEEFQARLARVDEQQIEAKLIADESTMNIISNRKLEHVQRAVGLRPKRDRRSHQHTNADMKPHTVLFEDFAKFDIRICTVITAAHAEGSDKLLKLTVNDGETVRTLMTVTREFFPDLNALIGKQLPVIVNLEPRTMRGYESQGMFLCADVHGRPILVTPVENVPDGSPLM